VQTAGIGQDQNLGSGKPWFPGLKPVFVSKTGFFRKIVGTMLKTSKKHTLTENPEKSRFSENSIPVNFSPDLLRGVVGDPHPYYNLLSHQR